MRILHFTQYFYLVYKENSSLVCIYVPKVTYFNHMYDICVVNYSLQALQLSEFQFVHQEICRAAYARTLQDSATQVDSERVASGTVSDDQQLMVARVAALEKEIVCRKQDSLKRSY
jgi:hypothetical protein